ncbi:MAG TPA: 2-dehydropantoate 2-reductase [Methanothrix sp.]|nr:2-dehydropantoate 2-reductase [Methanothrix sp.]
MSDILIYGAGAIGSFLGYLLAEVPADDGRKVRNVALLGRAGHIRTIRERGLQIDMTGQALKKMLYFEHCFASLEELDASNFAPKLVIVCVKTHALPALCQELLQSGLLQSRLKDATFILLMNGMGNRDVFRMLNLPASRVLEGIAIMGVRFAENGRIELKGMGKTVLEDEIKELEKRELTERFVEKGFEIEFSKNFKEQQYGKLFANAAINPITALTCQKNSIVLSQALRNTVHGLISEAVKVAAKDDIMRDEEEVIKEVYSVAEKTRANTSSMLQDVLNGKKTEIDAINGYIIRQAKKHGIDAPVNEALYELVKARTENDASRSLPL